MYKEEIPWIDETPLGLKIRRIDFLPPHMHENLIEIIFCLKGSVKFNYEYEQFTLHEGEFISVDKDVHYLYDGNDDVCVSFYIDLNWFEEKYPYITSLLFVCEAAKESTTAYKKAHDQLKGRLIALMFFLGKNNERSRHYKEIIIENCHKIVQLFIHNFDIIFFYNPELELKGILLERHHNIMIYMNQHYSEKITLAAIAEEFHLTESYVSEFLRTVNIGFRKCLGYLRACKSEQYLISTNLNITEISEICGFSDPKYYYAMFREWYRCTPRQFRISYKEKMQRNYEERKLNIKDTYDYLNQIMLEHYLEMFL